jgi:hypothetical protein
MRNTVLASAVAITLVTTGVYALATGDMIGFQPGTPIMSSELNQNFKTLKDALTALEARSNWTLPLKLVNDNRGAVLSATNSNALQGATGLFGTAGGASGLSTETKVGVWGDSASGFGVFASSKDNDGVRGISLNGMGIHGNSPNRFGVYGESLAGKGVYGSTTAGIGVHGASSEGRASPAPATPVGRPISRVVPVVVVTALTIAGPVGIAPLTRTPKSTFAPSMPRLCSSRWRPCRSAVGR